MTACPFWSVISRMVVNGADVNEEKGILEFGISRLAVLTRSRGRNFPVSIPVQEGDRIYVYPYKPSIYFLSARYPCVKVFILTRPVADENMELELLRQISESNPKYIVMETDAKGEIKPGLPGIYEFLVSHFQKDKSIGDYQLYRNSVIPPWRRPSGN